MPDVAQTAFAVLALGAVLFFAINLTKLIRNIRLAKPYWPNDNSNERWSRVFLIALGQKKMFKRPLSATLHLFVYVGFVIINFEVLEIAIDGLFGSHRVFSPYLGALYPAFINFFEFLAMGVLISCIIFLIRRNIIKVNRLNMYELTSWPRLDANIILTTEVLLMSAFISMNAADLQLQELRAPHYHHTGSFFFSGLLKPLFSSMGVESLMAIERFGWWFHIIGIFLFLNYLPFSKHLHILFAFPNTYYSKLESPGKMRNMPEVQREVEIIMGTNPAAAAENAPAPERFGAKDVMDLTTVDMLGAYSCTECGRCTAMCPANITGKLLSPRKIMMDTRDRSEEIGRNMHNFEDRPYDDGKSLLGDYITHEEILACTSCQACVEACPVNIDPLSIINQLRRYIIMDEAKSPSQWNTMFGNIENNQAPWQFSPSDRFKWSEDL